MTMMLTSVTMVWWADVPDSERVTSDVGVPSTYLVISDFIPIMPMREPRRLGLKYRHRLITVKPLI